MAEDSSKVLAQIIKRGPLIVPLCRFRKAVLLEVIIVLVAAGFGVENLVVNQYYYNNYDGSEMSKVIGPTLVKWDRIQNEAEVRTSQLLNLHEIKLILHTNRLRQKNVVTYIFST